MTTIGASLPMIDARERVTGRIEYVLDIALPGMLHARIVRSPYPHARVLSVDASAALAIPGVVAVLTRDDLINNPAIDPIYGTQIKDQPIVALDRVRYIGDAVAAIAAEDEDAAAEAALLVDVAYEELPAVFDPTEAMQPGAPLIHELPADWLGRAAYFGIRPLPGTNCCHQFVLRTGDVAAGFAQADVVIERTYTSPSAAHCPMEPHVAVAQFTDGVLTVYTATQTPFNVRDELAAMFHLPHERVRVITRTLGGSYGAKTFLRAEPIAAALAWKTGRPVRLVLAHDESFLTLNRHPAQVTVRLGVLRDGTITAKQVTAYWNTGAYADCGPGVAQKGGFGSVGPYRIPNVHVDSYCVYTNTPPNGAFRGYGVTQVAWASECAMDEAAAAIGMDPLAFRLKNLLHDGDCFATGEVMHDVHFAECLQQAAAAIGWGEAIENREPRTENQGQEVALRSQNSNLKRGKGLCVLLKGTTTPSTSEAAIEVDATGRVLLHTATIEMGQGARTVLAQLAADILKLPYDAIQVLHPDTTITPRDNRTTSSRSTYMMGNAVSRAALDLVEKLKEHASRLLEASVADLVIADGKVCVAGTPASCLAFGEIVGRAGLERLRGTGMMRNEGGLDPDTGHGIASSHWHQGAAAVEVAVDTETGKVELTRCHAVIYAGQVVNRLTAELQNEGSMLMGIGSALFEAIVFDQGQVSNPNLSDYMIPSILDMPASMTHTLLERPGADIHGVGETALPAIPAAVGNAVAAAIGVRIRDLPITPEKVLRALADHEAS